MSRSEAAIDVTGSQEEQRKETGPSASGREGVQNPEDAGGREITQVTENPGREGILSLYQSGEGYATA